MRSAESQNGTLPVAERSGELRIAARSVSRGVAIGKIVTLHGKNRQFYRVEIDESEVEAELQRLQSAFRIARRQINRLTRSAQGVAASMPGIFDAQLAMLEDSSLQSKIETEITSKRVNSEWAVKTVTDRFVSTYKAIADEHLRERYIDIEDVAERILAALGAGTPTKMPAGDNLIIAAQELMPSTLVELQEKSPKALITEHGGWTSHTFILARELNLPAVTGMRELLRRVNAGDQAIVDGYNGQVIVSPSAETLDKYRVAAAQFHQITYEQIDVADEPLKTLDGREIIIRANLDLPSVYKKARRHGARGIGLYRSEFLFNRFKGFPTEIEQIDGYREIADLAGNDGVTIRTFDLGIDNLYGQTANREKNPALGLRAVRLSLSHPKQFRVQLRALLRASFERDISILIPMVSGVMEIRTIREMLADERERLIAAGIETGDPPIGAMIEVPSAVLVVQELLEEADFISLGTNDLVQYLLAVDRDNENVANWFRSLHPAVIRALKMVIDASNAANKPLVVCGEMAGSPFYLPLLVGLGAVELSMNVNSILAVRKTVAGIAYEEGAELARKVITCKTADEIEEIVREYIRMKWSHLFPADPMGSRQM